MTMRVTIIKAGSSDIYGNPFVVGSTYSVSDDYGLDLVSQSMATDTDGVLNALKNSPFLGYPPLIMQGLPGRFYATSPAGISASGAVPAVDLIYAYPFVNPVPLKCLSLSVRVATGGAGSAFKVAIWKDANGLPKGVPIIVSNAGTATTASTATATATVAGAIPTGPYWVGTKFTGTLPAVVCLSQTDSTSQFLGGRVAIGAATASISLSTPHAYALDMPSLTGTEVWTDVTTTGTPLVFVGT